MQVPFRLLNALRLHTEIGLVAAMAVAMATFSATPLVLAPLATEFAVSTGTAALFSAAQLGSFVVGSWTAGRVVDPSRRLFVIGLVPLSAANVVAAFVGSFVVLVVTRSVSGLTWLAYSQVFGDDERTGDITTVGPLTAVVSAPIIGVLLELGDVRAVFLVLAGVSLVPLVWVPSIVVPDRTPTGRNRAVRAALVIIAALTIATLGGSAVCGFMGAIAADRYGMSALVISLAFSANALVSIPTARFRGRRRFAGGFFALTGVCAVIATQADQSAVLWVVLCLWGAAFWMAVPGSYTLLAERSRFPTERAGDAQAAMAFGRALGPLVAVRWLPVVSTPCSGGSAAGCLWWRAPCSSPSSWWSRRSGPRPSRRLLDSSARRRVRQRRRRVGPSRSRPRVGTGRRV